MCINKIIKSIIIYIVQIGTLWGLLEGYTYFKDDVLKEVLGPYWLLIYILPLFTTAFIIFKDKRPKDSVQENITTQGNFSPGKVNGNYAVHGQTEASDKTTSPDHNDEKLKNNESNSVSSKNIHTKGNFSPGEVGGDYSIEK